MKKSTLIKYLIIILLLFIISILLFVDSINNDKNQKDITTQREVANNTSKVNEFEDPENNKTLKQWQEINPDTKAILIFKEKQLPVVKGKDNLEYLHKNIYGEEDFYGVPYFDKDTFLNDENLIIYGHSSTKKDLVLTKVKDYEGSSGEDAVLITENGTFTYEPFTFIKINQEDEDRFMGWLIHNWENEYHFSNYTSWLSNENYTRTWFVPDPNTYKKYISIVTCDLSQKDGRYILMMRLKD